jgi:hypothetical protein
MTVGNNWQMRAYAQVNYNQTACVYSIGATYTDGTFSSVSPGCFITGYSTVTLSAGKQISYLFLSSSVASGQQGRGGPLSPQHVFFFDDVQLINFSGPLPPPFVFKKVNLPLILKNYGPQTPVPPSGYPPPGGRVMPDDTLPPPPVMTLPPAGYPGLATETVSPLPTSTPLPSRTATSTRTPRPTRTPKP